jgi:hypothetical protein
MSQTINTFVKSKMNKDLDDRLLSNGEYRDAQNVNVSRSEGEDVGALENVLGNTLLSDFGLSAIPNLEIIGFLSEEVTNRNFFIATNYTDVSSDELSNPAPYGANCYILMRDNNSNTSSILVQGRFLNFSKTHPVYGIDLIENLLFWTDNRNQPRKINIDKAIASNTYYTTEDSISVAKYLPYNAPYLHSSVSVQPTTVTQNVAYPSPRTDLYTKVIVSNPDISKVLPGMVLNCNVDNVYVTDVVVSSTSYFIISNNSLSASTLAAFLNTTDPCTLRFPSSQNKTSPYLSPSSSGKVSANVTSTSVTINDIVGDFPRVGMKMTCPGKDSAWDSTGGIASYPFVITAVTRVTTLDPTGAVIAPNDVNPPYPNVGTVNITLNYYPVVNGDASANNPIILEGDIVQFSAQNPYYVSNWPGDEEFLTDKFVRFAYRFKFDDGEYSVISPFTQPTFIPKQHGWVIDSPTVNNTQAYAKQEDEIGASTIISFMENDINNVSLNIKTPHIVNQLQSKLKIEEIDILYKESDALAIQLVETIPVTDDLIANNTTNILTYEYQSKKPFRTLPERETVRVFDKVPVRALSQSIVGNRVVYGNFLDKHTPPENLQYNVGVSEKYDMSLINTTSGVTTKPVADFSRISYPNHSVKQNRTYQVGIVLADKYGRQSDVVLSDPQTTQSTFGGQVFSGSTFYHPYKRFQLAASGVPEIQIDDWKLDSIKVLFRDNIPETQTGEYAEGYPGLYKSGEYTALVTPAISNVNEIVVSSLDPNIAVGDIINLSGTVVSIKAIDTSAKKITVSRAVSILNNTTITINGPANKLGWYSYKIVVKQTEQDYYNLYLPNICLASQESALMNSYGSNADNFLTTQSYYTSLISDNINKVSLDLQEVQPEQTQFRTSDDILFPRIGFNPELPTASSAYNPFSSNFHHGQNFVTVNNVGKVTDMGIQQVNLDGVSLGRITGFTGGTGATVGTVVYNLPVTGGSGTGARAKVAVTTGSTVDYVVITNTGRDYKATDSLTIAAYSSGTTGYVDGQAKWTVAISIAASNWTITPEKGTDTSPLTAAGIYNASSNPSTMQLSTSESFIIGNEANARNNVFSALEIKPLDSRLDIYWESSTSGLISELNSEISSGDSATPTPIKPR